MGLLYTVFMSGEQRKDLDLLLNNKKELLPIGSVIFFSFVSSKNLFVGSSSVDVRICCFSLSFLAGYEESLGI